MNKHGYYYYNKKPLNIIFKRMFKKYNRLLRKTYKIIVLAIILFILLVSMCLASHRQIAEGGIATETYVLGTKAISGEAGLIDPCTLDDVICPSEKTKETTKANTQIKPKVVSNVKIEANKKGLKPIKIGASKEQQKIIDYAWSISKDKDFIYMMDYENGSTWSLRKRSLIKGSNGYYDWGVAQINEGFHKSIVRNKLFFKDYKFQVDNAYRLYTSGTVFYGFKHRAKSIKNFKWISTEVAIK